MTTFKKSSLPMKASNLLVLEREIGVLGELVSVFILIVSWLGGLVGVFGDLLDLAPAK